MALKRFLIISEAEVMKLEALDRTMAKVMGERVVGAGMNDTNGVCEVDWIVSCFSDASALLVTALPFLRK